jgi:hypothetical protein
MQCFQKDPNLRVTAKKLLRHAWLVNAKKTDRVLSAPPTKYDEAVKSVQQWNEALKSPDADSIRRSRPTSLSPMPTKKEPTHNRLTTPAQTRPLTLTTTRPNTDAYRSPDIDSNDNWDADFATSISPSALQLPHLKPHDNFSGLLSMANLKSFANTEFQSQINDHPNGNVIQTMQNSGKFLEVDPLETVKPFTPRKNKIEKPAVPNTSSQRIKGPILQNSTTNKSVQPNKAKVPIKARPSSTFREDSVEDYSDLLEFTDDDSFKRKLEALKIQDSKSSFAPKLFHPSDLKNFPKPPSARKSSSLRRFPSAEQHKTPGLPRTRSSVEIQKYAEDENEDPEAFLEKDAVLPLHGSDSGSDRGTLMMSNSKLSALSFDEEDEYDDPFAQLEEDFDQMDLEANVARDRHARLCTFVEGLVAGLQVGQSDEVLDDLTDQLVRLQVYLKGTKC